MLRGKKRISSSAARRSIPRKSFSSANEPEGTADTSPLSALEASASQLMLKVTLFRAREIPELPASAEIFCKLSLANQVFETKGVTPDSLEWNTAWEFSLDSESLASSRFELDLMRRGSAGEVRLGRSIVPVQTLVHGSMPPTPAKKAGSGGAAGGIWYQLHDEGGVALKGRNGPSEIEIAFERNSGRCEEALSTKGQSKATVKGEIDLKDQKLVSMPEDQFANFAEGRSGLACQDSRIVQLEGKKHEVGTQEQMPIMLRVQSHSTMTVTEKIQMFHKREVVSTGLPGVTGKAAHQHSAAKGPHESGPHSLTVTEKPASDTLDEDGSGRAHASQIGHKGGEAARGTAGDDGWDLKPGHRTLLFFVRECKVAACEQGTRVFCDVFVEGKGISTERRSTRAAPVHDGLVQWHETLALQIPEECASSALVSITVMRTDSLVKTKAVGHVRRRPLRDCVQQTWMYAQYQGSSPGSLNGEASLFELHVRTEVEPPLESEMKHANLLSTPNSSSKGPMQASAPGSSSALSPEAGPALIFSSRRKSVCSQDGSSASHGKDSVQEETESDCDTFSRSASQHSAAYRTRASNHHADAADSGTAERRLVGSTGGYDMYGNMITSKKAPSSRRKKSPFELLENVWESTDIEDASLLHLNGHDAHDSNAHSAMEPSMYVQFQGMDGVERVEEGMLLVAAAVQPVGVADWVSKALALEKLLEMRDREALMRDRYIGSLIGQISDLQHALCALRGDDVGLKEAEGGLRNVETEEHEKEKIPVGYREQVRRLKERVTQRDKELERERARTRQLEVCLQQETCKVTELSKAVAENADSWALLETAMCQRIAQVSKG